MVTGEKWKEYRKPTKYIERLILEKDGSFKKFDLVRFHRGYTNKYFEVAFEGIERADAEHWISYGPQMPIITIDEGDYIIGIDFAAHFEIVEEFNA